MSTTYRFQKSKTALCFSICMSVCIVLYAVLFLSCAAKEKASVDVFSVDWQTIEEFSKGKTVYFNAWGGSNQINQYIQWVRKQVKQIYNINLVHVLVQDTMETIRRLHQEKAAGNYDTGSIDIVWLNGEAFNVMKNEDMFLGNILDILPNKKYLDENNPVLYEDFTIKTDGLEVPWGTAQLSFFHRSSKTSAFYNLFQLQEEVKKHPGMFTYPVPYLDFTGNTFLKNMMYLFADKQGMAMLYSPYTASSEQQHFIANNGVWLFLDTIHPYLWKQGTSFPNSYSEMITLFKDSEIQYGLTFNPYDAVSKVLSKEFSDDVRMFLLDEGTIANAHFLTVPFNATSKPAALVVINFLISPEAQARKADPQYWGDPTVLDRDVLEREDEYVFRNDSSTHPAGPPKDIGKTTIREFHSTWEEPIQEFWKNRYLK